MTREQLEWLADEGQRADGRRHRRARRTRGSGTGRRLDVRDDDGDHGLPAPVATEVPAGDTGTLIAVAIASVWVYKDARSDKR